jgi:hypothetical protein
MSMTPHPYTFLAEAAQGAAVRFRLHQCTGGNGNAKAPALVRRCAR